MAGHQFCVVGADRPKKVSRIGLAFADELLVKALLDGGRDSIGGTLYRRRRCAEIDVGFAGDALGDDLSEEATANGLLVCEASSIPGRVDGRGVSLLRDGQVIARQGRCQKGALRQSRAVDMPFIDGVAVLP